MGKRTNKLKGAAAVSLAAVASLAAAQQAAADEICVEACIPQAPVLFPSDARADNFFKYAEQGAFPGQSFDSYYKATTNAFIKLSDSAGSPDNALYKFFQKVQIEGTG